MSGKSPREGPDWEADIFGGSIMGLAAATSLAALMVLFTGSVAVEAQVRAETTTATGGGLPVGRRAAAVDVAEQAGLPTTATRTWSAAPVDFDGDGAQDVLIGHHFRGARLWQNQGDETYARVAKYAWPAEVPDRHNCAWADVDLNGSPDAYCAAGRGLLNYVKDDRRDNELWLQSSAGWQFSEVGTRWQVGDPCGRGRSVAFLYANGDRYPDLFVGNEVPRVVDRDRCDTSQRLPNEESKLFLNQQGRGFRYAPRFWDYGSGPGSRCAVVLDFNGDGWDDLFTCPRSGTPQLFANRGGRGLLDVTHRHRFDSAVTDADVFDLPRTPGPDLVTSSAEGFGYHLNRSGRFGARKVIAAVSRGEGQSVAAGDADGDGDVDVYGMVGAGAAGNPDDWIFLNDDHLSFTRVRVPSAAGAADDVVALDRSGTGRAEFLVLNGYNLDRIGPVQLIRLVAVPW